MWLDPWLHSGSIFRSLACSLTTAKAFFFLNHGFFVGLLNKKVVVSVFGRQYDWSERREKSLKSIGAGREGKPFGQTPTVRQRVASTTMQLSFNTHLTHRVEFALD